jgi:hypothetical protein
MKNGNWEWMEEGLNLIGGVKFVVHETGVWEEN